MTKECCTLKVSETDRGYCIEIEGEKVKAQCKDMIDKCCSSGMMRNWFQSCCPSGK